MWPWILWRLRAEGIGRNTLRGIVLTHNHIDHTGSAAALQSMGLEIMAHREEVPYLTGQIEMPGYGKGMMGKVLEQLDDTFLKPPAFKNIRSLESGQDVMGSHWQVVHAPGHSPGSLSLWNKQTGALMTGDTLTTSYGIPQGPHPVYTADLPRAMESARKLLDMEPRMIYPGHGRVVEASAFEKVRFELEASPNVCGGSNRVAHG